MKTTKLTFFLLAALLLSCRQDEMNSSTDSIDYRQEMRDFIINLSAWAKRGSPDFFIIPQNGQELVTATGDADGRLQIAYLQAIDAVGREDLFYGYDNEDEATPPEERDYMLALCRLCELQHVEVMAIDYCSTKSNVDSSYRWNEQNGFISFAADDRNITRIPAHPYNENSQDIANISTAKNFLYLINSQDFAEKSDFVDAVSATNYDIIIMDLYHNESAYTAADITRLKTKHNGGRRLVFCYMSIGEAEDYRYYWQENWRSHPPSWLAAANPDWPGNYKVKYWEPVWQAIIFGNEQSYLQKIFATGFDGAYLDLVDAFEYFEE